MRPYRCWWIEATEVGMGHYALPTQRELFRRTEPRTSLPPEVVQQLLLLFEQLLAEAAAFEPAVTGRIDEQQDHT